MPTERQKKLARAIVKNAVAKESKTQGQLLESVGYSKNTAGAYPGEVIAAEGVQEALKELGYLEKFKEAIPDEMLIKVHQEGLASYKMHSSLTEPDVITPDFQTRHKYLELAHKLRGDLIERNLNVNVEVNKANLTQDKIDEINQIALDETLE